MAIRLTRIYTRTGDKGTTALVGGARVTKESGRIESYGTIDELNSVIGIVRTYLPKYIFKFGNDGEWYSESLRRIQNELFDVGADLCNPVTEHPGYPPLRVDEDYIARLERACDSYNEALPVLRSFVLPGGTPGAALLHVARTVVRRAERSGWAAIEAHGDGINPLAVKYLNRLSDLLFILARSANEPAGDLLWKPGGER